MLISDFDYELPEDLIAQTPLANRAASRMLVVDRTTGSVEDHYFSELGSFLSADDTLVLNNTKVFPARLFGRSETGARVEIFLVRDRGENVWETLARPAKRLHPGKRIQFAEGLSAEVVEKNDEGRIAIKFDTDADLPSLFEKIGRTPLPPYIKRERASPDSDRERYQTVFAKSRGAIAAPTAGLHFTPEILKSIKASGVNVCEVTLHVGYGTFEPVRVDDLSKHTVLPEEYEISSEAVEILNRALAAERRIVAVGTTSTRTLETAIAKNGSFVPGKGLANLTITPGYRFKAVDVLLTNFHLPRSSLLVLVSTFGGHDLIMSAYSHAVAERYRFYSYGDCMLII